VKYLNNKAIIKRNIHDQIQVDLAMLALVYVYFYSSMFVACEVFGPLNSVTVLNTALWVLQCLFNMGFNCIIALQFIQFCNIFGFTLLNDWSDLRRLILIRILVFPLGFIIGSGLCSVGAGSCRKTRIYNYFLMDTIKADLDEPSMLSGITWISYGILILICQISIEIKRFLLNKADEEADNLAFFANRQLQDAMSKIKIQNPVQLKAKNQKMTIRPLVLHALFPRLFHHNLKMTDVTRGLTKTIPDTEDGPNLGDKKIKTSCQTSKIHKNENSLENSHNINIEDEIVLSTDGNLEDNVSVMEDTPIQVLDQNSYPINKSKPDQDVFQAWGQNKRLDLDPTENLEIPNFFELSKKSSRDQVKIS